MHNNNKFLLSTLNGITNRKCLSIFKDEYTYLYAKKRMRCRRFLDVYD